MEIPYHYTAHGTLPRARKDTARRLSANIIMRVPEIDGSAAPVVARARYPGYVPNTNIDNQPCYRAGMVELDYRVLDGQLMRRAVVDVLGQGVPNRDRDIRGLGVASARSLDQWLRDPGTIGLDTAQDAMSVLQDNMRRCAFRLALPSPGHDVFMATSVPQAESDLAHKSRDNAAERAASQRRRLEGRMAFVDGALYLPSRGPAVCWRDRWREREQEREIKVVPELAWMPDDAHLGLDVFAALDWDACIYQLAQKRPGAQVNGTIEVLDAGAFTQHPDEPLLRAAIRNPNFAIQDILAKARTTAPMRLYLDMLDIARGDEPCAEVLLASIADLVEAWHQLPEEVQNRGVLAPDYLPKILARVHSRAMARETVLPMQLDQVPLPGLV